MSDETEPDGLTDASPVDAAEPVVGEEPLVDEETVDGLPVLAEVRAVEVVPVGPIPVIQAAAVAATGFVAGAFAMAVVKRYGARKLAQAVPAAQTLPARPAGSVLRPVPDWPVGTSRTYLVNVRLIARSGE
jgi:hypothetical protein